MLVHCLAEQCGLWVSFVFRLCFIDYHGRRSGQFHHLQKMSRSNHWHGDQMEKVKTMKFIAEMKVFILIIFVEIFTSPELKAQVSFSDHLSSVVRLSVRPSVRKLFTFSSSSPEPLVQFQPNLAQSILG